MIKYLLDPLTIFWLFVLTAGICFYCKKQRAGRWWIILSLLWLMAAGTPFLPRLLLGAWENRYPRQWIMPANIQPAGIPILVLGSGDTQEPDLTPNDQLSETALQRLIEGIRIHRMLPGSILILSGYGGAASTSHAQTMAQTAISLGVDKEHIILQEQPKNTREEVSAYLSRFGTTRPPVLVTSASHMPRAMYLFNSCGISPYPAPTAHKIKHGPRTWIARNLTSLKNIDYTQVLISECIGMLHHRISHTCRD